MNNVLAGLQPEKVWHYFEKISDIPRGSRNEKAVADYIENFGKEHGFYTYRDEIHNVFIRKEASKGSEGKPALLFQGHTDMVCEKNNDVVHDFEKDPIDLVVENGWIRANGTTLGSDNGIAVAYMLAMLDDDELKHPTLECLFTSQEEIGLDGAKAFDASQVTAKMLINMDSGGEGAFTASCAGGMVIDLKKNVEFIPFEGTALKVFVTGLAGGHSGGQINKYLGNSNKLMARALDNIGGLNLVSFDGGSKDNAIPRECVAVISVADAEKAIESLKNSEKLIKAELGDADEAFEIIVEKIENPEKMMNVKDSDNILKTMILANNGVFWMSHSIDGLVDASSNMGVVKTLDDSVIISFSPRASFESQNDYTFRRIEILAEAMGYEVIVKSRYPGWAIVKNSPLREALISIYKDMTGKELELKAVHGGLEIGILASKIPGLDLVCIGPNSEGAHSPAERVNIASAERVYSFVKKIVEYYA